MRVMSRTCSHPSCSNVLDNSDPYAFLCPDVHPDIENWRPLRVGGGRCSARTKANGMRCRISAVAPGEPFCHVHASQATSVVICDAAEEAPAEGVWRRSPGTAYPPNGSIMSYRDYMSSEFWQRKKVAWSKWAVEAGHSIDTCWSCGEKSDNHLEHHHQTYDRLGDEAFGDIVLLCRVCHLTTHGYVESGIFDYRTAWHVTKEVSRAVALARAEELR